ncbi:aldose epimerase family protein [Novosphingobium sp. SG707]|uniref:aldose epimerase family protein n=1 Tax=Novosphingobium sp. SG707 TaxID=2586996 RepID=UPI001446C241|nr:aldose epimerase family protein [Novosphingobium sp. SG707]NKI98397.1 aldose 1-epimerase [Novosphingobium sp. SG707]
MNWKHWAGSAMVAATLSGAAQAATARREDGGRLADGRAVEAVTLANGHGVSARILAYGAALQKFMAPDRHGKSADIVIGLPDAGAYEARQSFFGVTVGRYANRIAGGKFTLDGQTYQLPLNDRVNSLHGGGKGFDRQLWKVESVTSGKVASVVLRHISPDGDSGYPGTLDVTVTYSLDETGNLTIAFAAKTDKPTIVNMTNHALFNLAGEGGARDAMDEVLTIPAARYTPVNAALIPTGELRAVAGTPFDFRKGRVVGQSLRDGHDEQLAIARGYDHNFAIDAGLTKTPKLLARLADRTSGRVLEVLSTEPGVQFYTGNFIDGTMLGKNRHIYRMGDGIALEPQKFPDTPNQPAFGSTRIDAQHPYAHTMVYRVSVAK